MHLLRYWQLPILTVLLMGCYAEYCHKDEIQKCLVHVVNALGSNQGGLFHSSINHYYETLDDERHGYIHFSSLNTIMAKIDKFLLRPVDLQMACSAFKVAEQCLHNRESWCNGEVYDQLEGIEQMFNVMCQQENIKTYRANFRCLTNNTGLEEVRKTCDATLQRNLQRATRTYGFNYSDDMQEENHDVFYTKGFQIPKTDLSDDNKEHLTHLVCSAVSNALSCYKGSAETFCNESAAAWAYKLRHNLVYMLMIDLRCEDYDPALLEKSLYEERVCFPCVSNASDCIDISQQCDSVLDCDDGSDEADELCKKGVNVAGVLIGLTVTLIIVVIIIVCVVKYKQDNTFDMSKKGSTEMMSITQEEVILGESTPPMGAGRSFIYKSVPNSASA